MMPETVTQDDILERIQRIRRMLETAWDEETAYDKLGGLQQASPGSSVGQCYVSALVALLFLEDFSPRLVCGGVGQEGSNHYWLEIGCMNFYTIIFCFSLDKSVFRY